MRFRTHACTGSAPNLPIRTPTSGAFPQGKAFKCVIVWPLHFYVITALTNYIKCHK